MLRIFSPTDKTYTTNGDKVIQPLKATVRKEDNDAYYLDLTCGTEYLPWIKSGNIIVADTPQGAQPFRILNPEITHTKITCKCNHIFYDSANYLIADSYVVDSTCNQALDHLNTATEPKSPFKTISDINTISSFRCVRKSLYEAITTVLERWGGHLVRDGWTIGIRQSIGADNGVVVRYGKNLKSIEASYDWSDVCTKILPEGANGLLLNALDSSQSLYMAASTQYDVPYCKTVQFSQSDIKQEDYKTPDGKHNDEAAYKRACIADLRQQAQKYLDEHCVPKVNYKMAANLEKITDIGDTIEVIDERMGLDMMTNVISFGYDCIQQRYTSIEFGTFKQTLSGLMGTVQQTATDAAHAVNSSIVTTVNDRISESENKITNLVGGSYVIYDGEQILVVDSLPKESAHNVLRINSAGIGFSSSGISGSFTSAWTIDGTLNMQNINVINLVADLIKGGTLTLGGQDNGNGVMLVKSAAGATLGRMDNGGLTMWATDGSHIVVSAANGLTGYDSANRITYTARNGVFSMRNGYIEEGLAVGGKLKIVPVTSGENNGVAFVALS
nr:MAG TPA: tail protein [Caudoviricetes sp.]